MKNNSINKGRQCLYYILVLFIIPLSKHALASNALPANVFKTPKLQQSEVHGHVTDDQGMPLAGVSITVKGSQKGSVSDFNGHYSIMVDANDVLVFSFIGFKTEEIPIQGRTELDVQLKTDITDLSTVEINAGYYSVKEKETTGNISRITANEIEKNTLTNPLAAIQGRMPGVEIIQTSGIPGSGISIKIRGQNSIRSNGNAPLYIVDGIPYASMPLGDRQTSGAIVPDEGYSPLNNINAYDIESIEVLKDADATAIYGSRGANGVVLITTKKGRVKQVSLNLNINSGLGSITNRVDLLETPEYLDMRQEAFTNDGITTYPQNAYDVNGTWDTDRWTDWQKELFGKTAYLNNIQGSISGGNSQSQFLISGNYNKQTTVFLGNFENNQSSILGNFNHKSLNDKLSVSFSTNYTYNKNILPPTSMVREALLLAPNAPELYNPDGSLNWEHGTWNNPLRNAEGKYQARGSNFIGNVGISYKIAKSLEFKTSLGYTESKLDEIKTSPNTKYNPALGLGTNYSSAIHNDTDRKSWILEPQLNWNTRIGNTKFNSLVGFTFQEQKANKLALFASGFTNNSFIENIVAANSLTVFDNSQSQYRYGAVFGRFNVINQDKYFLNITGRRDGSSRFGKDKKFANFIAIGAAWVFSNETLFKEYLPFLSFGKIRGSYGTSGNDQIGDYQYLDTYSFTNTQYQNVTGLSPTRLYNPNFSWEINHKKEIGLELGFLKDRLFINFSYYQNKSSNQLVGIPLPRTTGFNSLNANLNASVENKGWEFEFKSVNIDNDKLNWVTSFNLTIARNELLEFPDLEGSTYANTLVIGRSLNILKVYKSQGVNPQTGIFEFVDFNEDGLISAPYDKQIVKDLNPEYYGGLNNSFTYGKFNLDILLQFTNQLGLNYLATGSIVGTMNNQPKDVLNRWQNIGDQTDIQRYTGGSNQASVVGYSNYTQSDATFLDASYIRVKTLSLSYRLTSLQTHGFGCDLTLLGQNLFTFTKYNGLDPETRNSNTIPPLRFITLGTKLSF